MSFIQKIRIGEKGYSLAWVITAICILMEPALCYSYGYFGFPTVPISFFILFRFCRFLIFLVLIAFLMVAIRKRDCRSVIRAIIVVIALNMVAFILPGSEGAILRGMRNRIFRYHNLSEIRQFAREYDQLQKLPAPDVAHLGKRYTYKDLAKTGLASKYAFLSCLGTPIVYEEENVVFIVCGDPLKGIYVTVDGAPINLSDYTFDKILPVSTDIIFVTRFK